VEGRDFTVEAVRRPSPVLVMAPHGGRIEPVTGRLAEAVAAESFSLYCFRARMASGNWRLHLTSHRFDEPRALDLLAAAETVAVIHGQRDREAHFLMVGGRDRPRRDAVERAAARAGFPVRPPVPGITGEHPANICNRGRSGRGIQLEISIALRLALKADPRRLAAMARAIRLGLGPAED
jgi:phage replication-related protein YjqB (UPF0714/DUF867 family)